MKSKVESSLSLFTHAKVEPNDPAIEAIMNFDMKTLHERASCNKEAAVSIHSLYTFESKSGAI